MAKTRTKKICLREYLVLCDGVVPELVRVTAPEFKTAMRYVKRIFGKGVKTYTAFTIGTSLDIYTHK